MNYADKIIIHDSRPKVLENTSNYLDKITTAIKSPLINGGDLHKLAIKPGPEFRKILDNAALLQIEGFDKEQILNKIR